MTPVEVSAAGGAIALLLLLVVPSLNHVKQQARIRVCLSNLRTIGQAGSAYAGEFADLPWVLPAGYQAGGKTYNWIYFTEFIWGGGLTEKTVSDWEYSGMSGYVGVNAVNSDFNTVPPKYRPLNRYISADVHWDNTKARRVTRPKELPAVFKCPDDASALLPTVGGSNPTPRPGDLFRSWDWYGTSYATNWYWIYYYSSNGGISTLLDEGRGLLKRTEFRAREASRLVVHMENQLNFSLHAARPPGYTGGPWAGDGRNLVGWHGALDYHTAAFLDGSARYQEFDTRFLLGKNWTIWPAKPWTGRWAPYNDIDP
ncbi:MAG: hypothetical protein D6744_16705 [Planctomycetota bacterium]|nr:MAG: hypothetical protein D6744_16705 [Planctomycetota bacterium]